MLAPRNRWRGFSGWCTALFRFLPLRGCNGVLSTEWFESEQVGCKRPEKWSACVRLCPHIFRKIIFWKKRTKKAPNAKHPPPPRLPMNLPKTVHYGAAGVCCRIGRRVADRYRRDACATHLRTAANEPPRNAFIGTMNRFKKVEVYSGQARRTSKPKLQ